MALSQRIGHADVAFTMRQCVQSDLETDRQVATALAELIIGGVLASVPVPVDQAQDGRDDAALNKIPFTNPFTKSGKKAPGCLPRAL